ncbi:hypothetical protein D3C78_1168970 [compost metagenome]
MGDRGDSPQYSAGCSVLAEGEAQGVNASRILPRLEGVILCRVVCLCHFGERGKSPLQLRHPGLGGCQQILLLLGVRTNALCSPYPVDGLLGKSFEDTFELAQSLNLAPGNAFHARPAFFSCRRIPRLDGFGQRRRLGAALVQHHGEGGHVLKGAGVALVQVLDEHAGQILG